MEPNQQFWLDRAQAARDARRASLAMYRTTRDPRWRDIASADLEAELAASRIADEIADA